MLRLDGGNMVASPFMFTFPGGRPIDNSATLGAVTTISFTVPAGKRWIFLCASAEVDTSATFTAYIYNSSDKRIQIVTSQSAGTITIDMPYGVSNIRSFYFFPMKAGDYIKFTWGAAQGTPEVSCTVLELDE